MLYYDMEMFERDIKILANNIGGGQGYHFLYGVPRGGLPVAMALSKITGIPLIDKLPERSDKFILVVDDIIDSGATRFKYKNYNFACLHTKSHSKYDGVVYRIDIINEWINYWWEQNDNPSTIEDNIIRILELIGENPNRPGLIDTPTRVAKMYQEFFQGYDIKKCPIITTFENGHDGIHYSEMIKDEGYFFSMCEHHILPFFGHFSYGYIPNNTIMGASKIDRIIDYYSGKLQVAERLVNEVVNHIENICHPLGQVLIMNARHLCKEMRGVKKWDSPFEVIAVRGYFAENKNGCKDEFMIRSSR